MVDYQANEKTTNEDMIINHDDDIPLASIMKGIIKNKEIEEQAKREGKEKATEKITLKRKLVVSSDSDSNARGDVQDILPSTRREVGGKKILINVVVTTLGNVSFESESSA